MATMQMASLVDTDNGVINPRIFSDEEIYQQELEQIFAVAGSCSAMRRRFPTPATSSPPIWAKTRCWWCATVPARSARS